MLIIHIVNEYRNIRTASFAIYVESELITYLLTYLDVFLEKRVYGSQTFRLFIFCSKVAIHERPM